MRAAKKKDYRGELKHKESEEFTTPTS